MARISELSDLLLSKNAILMKISKNNDIERTLFALKKTIFTRNGKKVYKIARFS
jgi:hypothetical protein